MQKFISFLLCFLLAMGSLSAANNKAKKPTHKKITKTYSNAHLKDVIEDIGKRADYTINYAEAELDLLQIVKMSAPRLHSKKYLAKSTLSKQKRA